MILGNIKKIAREEPLEIMRVFLAVVFLTAGVFRIFDSTSAKLEFLALNLPGFLSWPVIIFEIAAGYCLLAKRYLKLTYSLLAVFISLALLWALVIRGREIIMSAGELFVFNLNPTDFLLHLVFLLIISVLLIRQNRFKF